jgi:hypothetical protein
MPLCRAIADTDKLPVQIKDHRNLPSPTTELPLSTIERSIGETPPSVFPGHFLGRPKHRKLGNFQTAELGTEFHSGINNWGSLRAKCNTSQLNY